MHLSFVIVLLIRLDLSSMRGDPLPENTLLEAHLCLHQIILLLWHVDIMRS